MEKLYEITLDLKSSQVNPVKPVYVAGDKYALRLRVTLMDGKDVYPIPDGVTVKLSMEHKNSPPIEREMIITDAAQGVVEYLSPGSEYDSYGDHTVSVIVETATSHLCWQQTFTLTVTAGVAPMASSGGDRNFQLDPIRLNSEVAGILPAANIDAAIRNDISNLKSEAPNKADINLSNVSNEDFRAKANEAGVGGGSEGGVALPSGGVSGQVLTKTPLDFAWITPVKIIQYDGETEIEVLGIGERVTALENTVGTLNDILSARLAGVL